MSLASKKFVKFFLASGIAVFILYFLVKKINVIDFRAALQLTDYRFLLLAFISYVILDLIRAWRFDLILEKRVGFFRLLNIVFLQNFFKTILPFHLGELSYVHLVGKNSDVSLGKNIASLIGARLLDFFSIAIIFLLSIFFISSNIGNVRFLTIFSAGLLTIAVLIFLALVWSGGKIKNFIFKLKNRIQNKFLLMVLNKFENTLESFALFQSRGVMFKAILSSFLIWIFVFILGIFLFKSINISIGLWPVVFIYSLPIFLNLVPFYTPAGLGLYESAITTGLVIFGVLKEKAIAASFIIHAQELIFVGILGLIGYFVIKLMGRNET